jgi:hypothetical protein
LVVIRIERVVLLQDAALPFCIDMSAIEAVCGVVDTFPPDAPAVNVVTVVVTVEVVVMNDVDVTVFVVVVVTDIVFVIVVDDKTVTVEIEVDVTVDGGICCVFVVAKFWIIMG